MILLLDTHVLLWWLENPSLLSPDARDAIGTLRNDVLVSSATVWELAIKRRLGKLSAPPDLLSVILTCRFRVLSVTAEHALATGNLPDNHRDPFDRMLIAQAMLEAAVLVTRDERILEYDVPTLKA